jgi:hypothetical protein
MSIILRWLIVIPFALLVAVSVGLIAFFVASAVVPELGLLVGAGFQALVASVFDEAMAGTDPTGRLFTAFALSGRLALAIFVLPVVLTALACEIFGLRGGLLQISGTGALAALLPLAMLQLGRSPTLAEGRVIAALFFTGAVIGLFYWLIAGRKAGSKRAVSAPVSSGS